MEKKVLVTYTSKYGTTKQYARWIAEALGAELAEAKAVKPKNLQAYDVLVHGGGLYAGGIAGARLLTRQPCKHMVVFTVGLGNPASSDYSAIIRKNFAPELAAQIKIFHLRGGIDYKRLGPVHKAMMAMMKRITSKNLRSNPNAEDREFMETYGAQIDFSDRQSIEPLVAYVKSL